MTDEELTRLEALATAATAGPCERCTHAKATQCDGDDGRDGCPCACHGKLRLARVIYEGEAVRSVPALVAEVRRLKILELLLEDDDRAIRRLRDKLSEQAATVADLHTLVREYLAMDNETLYDASEVMRLRRALRAAVATPPDTGWRDRAPTEAEVRAHRRGHPDEHTSMAGLWMYQPTEGMLQVWALYGSPDDAPGRWRPLTASGDPCAWPEVTP